MAKYFAAFALVLVATALPAAAAPPVRTMYVQATTAERTVREALARPAASAEVLRTVRRAIASYEAVVRRYPASGYSDNALWQAAHLALDAFSVFGDVTDQDTGHRLLRRLAAEYPTSKLAKQIPDLLARPDGRAPDGPKGPSLQLPSAGNRLQAVSKTGGIDPQTVLKVAGATASTGKTALLTNIQRSVLPDVIRVTIALDAEVPFHDERLAGPSRIFIDFPSTRAATSLVDRTLRFDRDSDLVRQVRIGRHPNTTTRVVLDATGISSYSVYAVYNPYRLVIDCIRETSPGGPHAAPVIARMESVGRSRPGPVDPASLAGPIGPALHNVETSVAAKPMAKPLAGRRITTTWARTLPSARPGATAALVAASPPPAAPLPSHRLPLATMRRSPNVAASSTALIADALAPPLDPAPVMAASIPVTPLTKPIAPPTAPTAPARNLGSGFSMARQLGLGVSRIVIDPGHGGHDPGAKGRGGLGEAALVLDIALRLQKLLEKVPGVEVILTRSTDDYVPLPERTAIANRENADLFLSIHANASANDQAHGIETYFLNFANNLSAAAVAARENAASGQAMGALPDFVRAIALNNKLDESRDFATLVQESMVDRLRATNKTVKNLGVKQAPFVVLIGASMPSVLAEISFLTNTREAKLLKGNPYRQRIAEALFNAVRKYQGSLKGDQRVAVQ